MDAGNAFVPVKENSELTLACISEGGNPKPILNWEVLISPGVDRHSQKVSAEVLELQEIKNEKVGSLHLFSQLVMLFLLLSVCVSFFGCFLCFFYSYFHRSVAIYHFRMVYAHIYNSLGQLIHESQSHLFHSSVKNEIKIVSQTIIVNEILLFSFYIVARCLLPFFFYFYFILFFKWILAPSCVRQLKMHSKKKWLINLK